MQGSNNGTNWVNLESQNNIPDWQFNPTNDTTYNFSFNNTNSYTYYRLRILNSSLETIYDPNTGINSGECQIKEIELYRNIDTDFIVTTNGNVGVGLENPTEKLHVSGNILASGSITPDYVFESYFEGKSQLKPGYQFTELEETIEFTKKHHHLPGIPSAKEVEQQGGIIINQAVEQNLEKIEELYLHLCELHQKVNALEAKRRGLSE